VIDDMLMHTAVTHGFPTEGYHMDRMVVGYACENNEKLTIHTLEDLEHHLENCRSGDSYMFTPIHFREETVGFSILKNGRFLYEAHQFFDVHTEFIRSLESMRKRRMLERMYKELKMMYNRDPMTGLYNRNAYLEIIKPEFLKYCEEEVPCALIFYDVDFFKEINDSQGHEFGDRVLIRIANVLERNCPGDGYVYRFGGDEFIVFFPNATRELAEVYNQKVKTDLDPFQISLSPGVVITDPLSGKDLDEYLIQADCQMYESKRIRHKME
jgi:diguanylate cyclase (GGDEF)-like protein